MCYGNGPDHCRGWPTSPMGGTIRLSISAGFSNGCGTTMPQPTAEVGMGDRLLSCERIHLQASGGVVFRRPARPSLGTEDVPLAEKETTWDLPRLALSGSNPAAADRGG